MMIRSVLLGAGSALPRRIVRNADLEGVVETSDEWIRTRTGIIERRYSAEDEFTSDLSIAAVKDLAQRYDKDISDVDFILVATVTHDQIMPSMACQLQYRLDIPLPLPPSTMAATPASPPFSKNAA